METPLHPLPEGIGYGADLSQLSSIDRAKHHAKQLRSIAFHQGLDGVTWYKRQHPDAANIRVNLNALAYSAKPKGYDDYLLRLVDQWLTSDAVNDSNITDVERLNAHFGGNRFNPANHFSKPLSAARLRKLSAKFLEHGVPLDTGSATSLSKIKLAARGSRDRLKPGRPFGRFGTIADGELIVGNQRRAVMLNHGHEAIKLTVNGKQVWLRLDVLTAALDFLAVAGEPSLLPLQGIGDEVADSESPDFDPLADDKLGDRDCISRETVTASPVHLSLSERVAALKAAIPVAPAIPDDVDPLTL